MSVTDLSAPEMKPALPYGALRLGEAIYHPEARQLEANGERQLLEPRLGDLLMRLARAGGPVSREMLLDDVWGDEGSDEALTQAISKLRRALGDTSRPYRIIETTPKYGYRLRRGEMDAGRNMTLSDETSHKDGHKAGESLGRPALTRLLGHLRQHRSFLTGVVTGAGGVTVLAAIWIVLNGPGEIEQEIVCPEQASGAECLEIVNAVLDRGN